ncbi:MAG TPA: hypothetical protein PKK48_07590 [Phycisphaerae bacterium]|nr:hypothetical protein [Phycisphaerae bacterium]HPS52489.1 hypothetical protein [Phycisphaerae bacterium]
MSNAYCGSWKIDSSDRFIEIDEKFERFSRENPNFHFSGAKLGKSFHDFLHSVQLSYFYRTLIYRVRYDNAMIELPVRCDTSALKRSYRMHISRLAGSATVEFTLNLVKEEKREHISFFDLGTPRDEREIRVCFICGLVKGNGVWELPENHFRRAEFGGAVFMPRLTHTVCKSCLSRTLGIYDDVARNQPAADVDS